MQARFFSLTIASGGALVIAATALSLGMMTQPLAAAPSLVEEQRALATARAQARAAEQRSIMLERRAQGAAQQADRARDRAAAMAARIQQAEADLRAAEARIAILTRLQADQARRLAQRQAPVARLVAGLQTLARRPALAALLQPGSARDAVHLRIVLGHIMPVIAQRTAGLRAEIGRSRALRADAERARGALARSRDTLTLRRSELARIESERRIASRDYRETAAIEAERALAMGEDARDIVDLMARMEQASGVRERLMTLPGPSPRPATPGAGRGLPASAPALIGSARPAYGLPVVGEIVTGFGEVSNSGVRSRGLTLATAPGATVTAPADGRVAFAGPFRDFGQIVILDHGGGWTTLVTQMRRLSVTVGHDLRQGEPIGTAGPSKPQITIELRRGDRPVDIAALVR